MSNVMRWAKRYGIMSIKIGLCGRRYSDHLMAELKRKGSLPELIL